MATLQATSDNQHQESATNCDWLVQADEVKRRRLVRRTPRHNIYKADWFGDVLVYEPTCTQTPRTGKRPQAASWCVRSEQKAREVSSTRQTIDTELELKLRLSQLNIGQPDNKRQPSPAPWSPAGLPSPSWSICSSVSGYESGDSAHSSVSSTPRFSRSNNNNSQFEFEFPVENSGFKRPPSGARFGPKSGAKLSEIDNITTSDNNNNSQDHQPTDGSVLLAWSSDFRPTICGAEQSEEQQSFHQTQRKHQIGSLVVNLGSFGACCATRQEVAELTSAEKLNQLRLVAHEGFLLFMGSWRSELEQQIDCLVMQPAHPEAASLAELIHGGQAAPQKNHLNRFFPLSNQPNHQLWPLDNKAKLDICKQVINAMNYLHEKNMVHSRLTSVNIYLEPNQRVKISLLDDEQTPLIGAKNYDDFPLAEIDHCSSTTCSGQPSNLPALTYLSPELFQEPEGNFEHDCDTKNQHQFYFNTQALDKQSDVYSLGTLLFELFEERMPFSKTVSAPRSPPSRLQVIDALRSAHSPRSPTTNGNSTWTGNIKHTVSDLVNLIRSGRIFDENPTSARCPNLIRHLIKGCWNADPNARPSFKQLNLAMRWQQQ